MYYSVNDIKLFVRDEGTGKPALVFLHFWGGSSNTWNGVTSILTPEFRCISYDHRGWGQSDKPASGYGIRELANDTLALIGKLHLDNYILVGHSMGGKIAQFIASRQPAGLRKLILVAPSPAGSTILPKEFRDNMRAAYTSRENINATIDEVFKAASLPHDTREQVIRDMQSHNESSRLGWPDIALLDDVSEGLGKISIPTLIIAGEKDIVDTPERLEQEVRSKIPGAKMVILPGAGHLSMLQYPKEVAVYIHEFSRH